MYAIIQHGSKQFRVEEGDLIDIDLVDINEGEVISFDNVLLVNDNGKHHIATNDNPINITVQGVVETPLVKGPKIQSIKFKRRQNQVRKFGHRQPYTRVKITKIAA